ncbi:hypothetical protein GPJ56_003257 [Histomonas meleagridis]|uniref:uncharacterized protein n=1 Tax=Histomonas meleagridis TaxID=135588 RepID=UPI003559E0B1|nr:hypothetical protein GPJ56_003257 [Histomonas meleagridis]KAH0802423.1 hypothetical protein GO595_004801 [Histomonas meleagridis]
MLKEELNQLRSENNEGHEKVSYNKKLINQYEQQSVQIERLISLFQEKNKDYGEAEVPDISSTTISEINEKINEILEIISQEYSTCDYSELETEIKSIRELRKAIDHEISLLSLIDKNEKFDNSEDITSILAEEYSLPTSSQWTKHSISDITFDEFKLFPTIIENFNDSQSIDSKVEALEEDIQNLIKILQYHENMEKSIYSSQLEFFQNLKNLLENKKINEQEMQIIESQIQNRLKIISQIDAITPLVINEELKPQSTEGPDVVLSEQFRQFYENLQSNHMKKDNQLSIEKLYEETLEIPAFVPPPKPKCIRKTEIDKELIKFSQQIQQTIERTKTFISDFDSFKPSFKSHVTEDVKDDGSIHIQLPEIIQDDETCKNTSIQKFQSNVISKLPQNIAQEFQQIDFSIPIEEVDVPQSNENFELPPPVESNISQRRKALTEILSSMVSCTTPQISNVVLPQFIAPKTKKVDTSPILETIESIMNPSQLETQN